MLPAIADPVVSEMGTGPLLLPADVSVTGTQEFAHGHDDQETGSHGADSGAESAADPVMTGTDGERTGTDCPLSLVVDPIAGTLGSGICAADPVTACPDADGPDCGCESCVAVDCCFDFESEIVGV